MKNSQFTKSVFPRSQLLCKGRRWGLLDRLHIFIYNFMKNVLCCHLLELSAHCCDSCVHLPERLMCELSQLMTRSLHRLVQMSRATRLTLASAESSPSRIEQTVSTFDTQCSSIAASTFACVTSQTPVTISCNCTNQLISATSHRHRQKQISPLSVIHGKVLQ